MVDKEALPVEVHDHFRKANVLHGYVAEHLASASEHALETGQELLAAKKAVPPGRWEDECERLFAPSLRTAQRYMQFAKHVEALPKTTQLAVLMLEGTLDGAAKAAKKAAKPKTPKPKPDKPIDVESKPAEGISDRVAVQLDGNPIANNQTQLDKLGDLPEEDQLKVVAHIGEKKSKTVPAAMAKLKITPAKPDLGKCPNCAGAKWKDDEDGVSCAKCRHPHGEPAGDADEDRITTQRQKTVKTVEALMRAFDDLQVILAKPEHDEAIKTCKQLLKTAKGWK